MWPSCTRRWKSWKRKWKLRQRHLYVLRTLHLVWKGKKSCNTYQLSYVSYALYLWKINAAAEASLAAAHTAFGMKRKKTHEPWFFFHIFVRNGSHYTYEYVWLVWPIFMKYVKNERSDTCEWSKSLFDYVREKWKLRHLWMHRLPSRFPLYLWKFMKYVKNETFDTCEWSISLFALSVRTESRDIYEWFDFGLVFPCIYGKKKPQHV